MRCRRFLHNAESNVQPITSISDEFHMTRKPISFRAPHVSCLFFLPTPAASESAPPQTCHAFDRVLSVRATCDLRPTPVRPARPHRRLLFGHPSCMGKARACILDIVDSPRSDDVEPNPSFAVRVIHQSRQDRGLSWASTLLMYPHPLPIYWGRRVH